MPSTNCLPVSILRSFVCYGGNELQSKMSFDDFLLYKGDEIDNVAYSLAVALLRTHPEQTPEAVLAWDMSVIAPIVEVAQTVLQRSGKKTYRPYFEETMPCFKKRGCKSVPGYFHDK